MNNLIAWFARNSVSANVLMFVIWGAGLLVLPNIQKEILPNININQIVITAAYPGASPTEVEEGACIRIENAIAGLKDIESIKTIANEQVCIVNVEVSYGGDSRVLMEKIKGQVDAIGNFPAGVTRPIVKEFTLPNMVARIMVSGQADELTLRSAAEHIRDDLLDLGLAQVNLTDTKGYEISIEISSAAMERYNLNFLEVAQAIKRNAIKVSSGAVNTDSGAVAVATVSQIESAEDYRHIVLRPNPDGGHITLGDVATVRDGLKESNTQTLFDGEPATSISIMQDNDHDILKISQLLQAYMAKPKPFLPPGIKATIDIDTSKYFSSRITLLVNNALGGLVLVFLTLLMFLTLRMSFWVSMGIPTAFFGGFIVLALSGGSVNMVSTFGLLIVLGIVVDDAIVIGENVYTHQNLLGRPGVEGAVSATQEIAVPVVLSVLTTALTFVPLLFLPGADGQLFKSIPIIVISVLLMSLFEALFILPAHLAHQAKVSKTKNRLERMQESFNKKVDHFLKTFYSPLLDVMLNWRYTAILGFVSALFLSIALIVGGWINVSLLSEISGDVALATVELPRGAQIEDTEKLARQIERAALVVKRKLDKKYGVEQISHVRTTIGATGDHTALIVMTLATSDTREVSGDDIIEAWRHECGELKGAKVEFNARFNKPGPEFDIELSSQNSERLAAATRALREHLQKFAAIYNIRDSQQGGKREIQLKLKPNAYDIGLDPQNLAMQVSQGLQGMEIQSLTRNKEEVAVTLRLPKEERGSLWHLENMNIQLLDGSRVPLMAVAEVYYGTGPSSILRHNRKRVVEVSANIDQAIGIPAVINRSVRADFLASLEDEFPGVTWSPAGAHKQQEEIVSYLWTGFLMSVLAMFLLMATMFRSYAQPLLVLTAVPFGLVGALLGHVIIGEGLTLWSAAGMIAVSGVVVNDNMVMIFYINEKRQAGSSLIDAVREAGVHRFRPIMLTTLTTFAGLAPLMANRSWEASFLVPMAASISFGVLFATLVTLVLVPCLYLVLDDFAKFWRPEDEVERIIEDDDDDDIRFSDDGIVR